MRHFFAISTVLIGFSSIGWGAVAQTMARPVTPTGERPTASRDGWVTTHDGLRLSYHVVGNGPSTVIVPLGFLMGDFKRLATPDRTMVFYDQRNRGRSDATAPEKLSIHDEVRDLETLREHLGARTFSPIGYSYLGLMVVMYALEYPSRVERIVQLGPVPMSFDAVYPSDLRSDDRNAAIGEENIATLRKLIESGLREREPEEFCRRQWQVTRFALIVDPSRVSALGDGACHFRNEWPATFAQVWPIRQAELRALRLPPDRLRTVTQPVLTIHGRKDRNAPYGSGREWAATLPNARLVTLDNAAHQSWVDEPDTVFGAVDEFLRGRWPKNAVSVRQ